MLTGRNMMMQQQQGGGGAVQSGPGMSKDKGKHRDSRGSKGGGRRESDQVKHGQGDNFHGSFHFLSIADSDMGKPSFLVQFFHPSIHSSCRTAASLLGVDVLRSGELADYGID